MKFDVAGDRYEPPRQGFRYVIVDVEDGPRYEQTLWRRKPVEYVIVRVNVKIYDDGSYEWFFYENKIRKDGKPYATAPTRVYESHSGRTEAPVEEVRKAVLKSGVLDG